MEPMNPIYYPCIVQMPDIVSDPPLSWRGSPRLVASRVCSVVMSRGVTEDWTHTRLQAERLSISPICTGHTATIA